MRNFKNYEVWQRTIGFIKNVYQFTDKLPNKEKYNLIICIELGYTKQEQVNHLFEEFSIIQKMLNNLYRTLTGRR